MAIFIVRHITTYRYKREIRLGRHQLMARPRDSFDQRLINFSLDVTPKPSEVRWLHDVFGNCVAHVDFDCVSDHLRFECVIKVDHTPENAPDFRIEDYARKTIHSRIMRKKRLTWHRMFRDGSPTRKIISADGWTRFSRAERDARRARS